MGIAGASVVIVVMNLYLLVGIICKQRKAIWIWMCVSTAGVWAIFVLSLIMYGIDKRMGKELSLSVVMFYNGLILSKSDFQPWRKIYWRGTKCGHAPLVDSSPWIQ